MFKSPHSVVWGLRMRRTKPTSFAGWIASAEDVMW